jgi:hypothetical protein
MALDFITGPSDTLEQELAGRNVFLFALEDYHEDKRIGKQIARTATTRTRARHFRAVRTNVRRLPEGKKMAAAGGAHPALAFGNAAIAHSQKDIWLVAILIFTLIQILA